MEIGKHFKNLPNFAHIYEEDEKIHLRSIYERINLTTFTVFDEILPQNFNKILFPDKAKNLKSFPIYVVYFDFYKLGVNGSSKWKYFIDIVAVKLNATLTYIELKIDSQHKLFDEQETEIGKLLDNETLDFYLSTYFHSYGDLQSYNYVEMCYVYLLPEKYSIYELILFLPLDKSCWMFLGITTAFSAVLWRFLEGPESQWEFLFGIYSLFVGQFSNVRA